MICYRSHFTRVMAGTARVEHMQVLSSPAMEGTEDAVIVDTWSSVGGSVKHTRTHLPDTCAEHVEEEHLNSIRELEADGWEHCFSAELSDAQVPDEDLLMVRIEVDFDLRAQLADLAATTTAIGLPLETQSQVYLGAESISLQRRRRKAGETRELRYDILNAKVPRDGLAAQVLSALAIHHGGIVMDFKGNPEEPRVHASELANKPEFAAFLQALGINMPRITPGRLVRPWGQTVQPAVF